MAARTSTTTLRERRRAETVREILRAAEAQIVQVGAQGLSLRAVARELGMTVQAIYHYFASRDELLTVLVANAHNDLADAVERAHTSSTAPSARETTLDVARAYRRWAVENPSRFGLAYGLPVTDYAAPPDGPTTVGPRRMGGIFASVLFADWTPGQLSRLELPGVTATNPADVTDEDLPPAARDLLLICWARMHGLVTLEVFGHLDDLADPSPLFDTAMRALLDDLQRLQFP